VTGLDTEAVKGALREASGKWMDIPFDGETWKVRTKLTIRAAVLGREENLEGLVKALFADRHDEVMDEWGWHDLQSLCEVLAGGPGNSETSSG
jgi:hypothetical protein